MEATVRSHRNRHGKCGGLSGTGRGSCPCTLDMPGNIIPPRLHSYSPITPRERAKSPLDVAIPKTNGGSLTKGNRNLE